MINGKHFDWEDISVMMPHGVAALISEISYDDEQPVTPRYGRGAIPKGYGRGNYKATGSAKLDREEWEELKTVLAATGLGSIYDHEPFPIVVSYANRDQAPVIDTLRDCKISKFSGGGGSQGDDNVSSITLEFEILKPILWNGTPAKIDRMVPKV